MQLGNFYFLDSMSVHITRKQNIFFAMIRGLREIITQKSNEK
jgi:hypothetical protein